MLSHNSQQNWKITDVFIANFYLHIQTLMGQDSCYIYHMPEMYRTGHCGSTQSWIMETFLQSVVQFKPKAGRKLSNLPLFFSLSACEKKNRSLDIKTITHLYLDKKI